MTFEPNHPIWEELCSHAAKNQQAAIEKLSEHLIESRDWPNLFYARLLAARVQLGVSPFPTGPATDLPPESHEPYEAAIEAAAREVGNALLTERDIPRAWNYFRLIHQMEPIRQAIADFTPTDTDDIYPIIEVAWHHQVYPEKGFDLILEHHGICSAITMVSGTDLRQSPTLRSYCVSRLIHALHRQLHERLRNDLSGRGQSPPDSLSVPELLALNPAIPGPDESHIDTSHLSSVVQMALELDDPTALEHARELALYGSRLSEGLQGRNDPPFDRGYMDYILYLDILTGRDTEAGWEEFRKKIEAGYNDGYRYPVEVLIQLLVRQKRWDDALDAAENYLADEDDRNLNCPGITELCRRAGKMDRLADHARKKCDPVLFLASLIAAKGSAG